MKIKAISLLLSVLMLVNVSAFASFSDITPDTPVGNAVEQLSAFGVLNGFGDGTFRPDRTLTRGQFAKIAVCMMNEEQQAQARRGNNVFSDVASGHWASGYINYIAEKEIINGYPNGKFGAEDTITYAQALTILVRLLGYEGADVAYKWPDGYIAKAQALGITEGMHFGTYENITRGNAAYVIYNTLLAEKKEGSKISLLTASKVEDIVIYADWTTDTSLPQGTVSTTKGAYKLADSFKLDSTLFGKTVTVYLDSDQKIMALTPANETYRTINISSAAISGDGKKVEITFSEGTEIKTESFPSGAAIFYDGKSSTLSGSVTELESGREAWLIYNESGIFARMYLQESTLSGPETVTTAYSQIYSLFDISDAGNMKVIRDGKNAQVSDIQIYDVVYYIKGNNTLYAYTDKINGVYEEAYPLKANVSSVKIAGREYTLSTQKAINKMNTSQNAFEIGDRVTLLLGRNGEVVDVVDLATMGSLDLAVLTGCYSEISAEVENQGETIHYVDVVISDGTTVTYEVKDDYSDYIGNVVKVEYENEIAKLTAVNHSSIYGEYNSTKRTLDGHWIADDCTILELVKHTSSGAMVNKINLHEIQTTKLGADQVLHAETTGDLKDINFLYVTDVTMKNVDMGVVVDRGTKPEHKTRTKDGDVEYLYYDDEKTQPIYTSVSDGTFTILLADGSIRSVRTAKGWSNGAAVAIKETSEGTEYKTLLNVKSGLNVEGYSNGRIRVDKETYAISDYVKVFGGKTSSEFESMSVSQLVNNENIQKVMLYSDRPINQGGIVRVIVAITKK